jgi:DNA-binding transcriptional regulator YiaG
MSEKKFSEIVKAARARLGLTQVELAKTLRASQQSISCWEDGRRVPPEFTRRLILAELAKMEPVKGKK